MHRSQHDKSQISDFKSDLTDHDWLHADDVAPLRGLGRFAFWWLIVGAVTLTILALTGCTAIPAVPEGLDVQVTTFGLSLAPGGDVGSAIAYPNLTIGSKTVIVSSAPPNGVAHLSRAAARAPFVDLTATVAGGDKLAEQLPSLAPVLQILHAPPGVAAPLFIPVPAPPAAGAPSAGRAAGGEGPASPQLHLPAGQPFLIMPMREDKPPAEQPLNLPPAVPARDGS